LEDESPPDGSDSLYQVLTLTTKPTRRSAMKDESPMDDSDSLHRAFALITKRPYGDSLEWII